MSDNVKRLEELSKKVKEFEVRKIQAEQEAKTLKEQYNLLLQELQEKGITDVNNLPDIIASLEADFNNSLSEAEQLVADTERKIQSLK